MYGTRPCCLVQAITWHMCPEPCLGPWNYLAHQAHITPSEPMSNINQQGSSLDSFPTPLPFIPTLTGLRAFDLASSLVWWEILANIGTLFTAWLSSVSGSHFGWPSRAERFGLASEAVPQGFKGVRFIAWRLRRLEKGNADGAPGIFGTARLVWASGPT